MVWAGPDLASRGWCKTGRRRRWDASGAGPVTSRVSPWCARCHQQSRVTRQSHYASPFWSRGLPVAPDNPSERCSGAENGRRAKSDYKLDWGPPNVHPRYHGNTLTLVQRSVTRRCLIRWLEPVLKRVIIGRDTSGTASSYWIINYDAHDGHCLQLLGEGGDIVTIAW